MAAGWGGAGQAGSDPGRGRGAEKCQNTKGPEVICRTLPNPYLHHYSYFGNRVELQQCPEY